MQETVPFVAACLLKIRMKSPFARALTPFSLLLTCGALTCAANADFSKMDGVSADAARPGFTFKAEKAMIVSEPVRIPREVSSVCAFNVLEGPSEVDVAFDAGMLETGGACGIAKEGPAH